MKLNNYYIYENQEKLKVISLENQELKADMAKKINESVQFSNLKKMLQTKNDQLNLFRTK